MGQPGTPAAGAAAAAPGPAHYAGAGRMGGSLAAGAVLQRGTRAVFVSVLVQRGHCVPAAAHFLAQFHGPGAARGLGSARTPLALGHAGGAAAGAGPHRQRADAGAGPAGAGPAGPGPAPGGPAPAGALAADWGAGHHRSGPGPRQLGAGRRHGPAHRPLPSLALAGAHSALRFVDVAVFAQAYKWPQHAGCGRRRLVGGPAAGHRRNAGRAASHCALAAAVAGGAAGLRGAEFHQFCALSPPDCGCPPDAGAE